jgi:MYXO-CTERM domain-containing protein
VHAVDCASFASDGEDGWDPLVDCADGCSCAGASPRSGRPLLGLLALLALGFGRRQSQSITP